MDRGSTQISADKADKKEESLFCFLGASVASN
jgi:hypothetical protein